MWDNLKQENKEKYKSLITNFASLSEAFSQKSTVDSSDEVENYVAPIVNSKFQETVFQKSFGAVAEDIANTSYDASLKLDDNHKYLIGLKSFGFNSGDQKIAQFKKNSQEWNGILDEISFHSSISKNKKDADQKNKERYDFLAKEISTLRNQRIASSKAQIRGFHSNSVSVESLYHVLMPTPKGEQPKIYVGETSYLPIDIDNIEILGATSQNNPTNFRFTDGKHIYKYTAADSQLYMSFNNKDIIVDTWDVTYIQDPFYIFENLHLLTQDTSKDDIEQTVSWMISDAKNEVKESSGYNAFDGGTKLARKDRAKRIQSIKQKYSNDLTETEQICLISYLEKILLQHWSSTKEMKLLRSEMMIFVESLGCDELTKEIQQVVYRPVSELYIPIPDSRNFHQENPDFFGKNIGTFKENSNKLALVKEDRIFTLRFLPSGDEIESYINQDNGKAIQSTKKQGILGEWILKGIFQLKERERLTYDKLLDLEINAVRLTKYKSEAVIGIEFIWIDVENPPKDAIGWVAK